MYEPTGPGIQVRFLGTGGADWRGPAANGELRRHASILADLDKQQPIGLLGFSGLIQKMEKATGRAVDLIPSGSLKPYAIPEAERDKYLIYERAR